MLDIKLPSSPYDLLPIDNPKIEPYADNPTFFYENVAKPLLETVLRMESNGIPIDLYKVAELEDTVSNILQEVRHKLRNNNLICNFLKKENEEKKGKKKIEYESKKKTVEDFIKPLNINNKIHRSYLVNTYLRFEGKEDMILPEWSIKDLHKLNQVIASKFINDLLDKESREAGRFTKYAENLITMAMEKLAEDKCEAYNKNRIDSKIDELEDKNLIDSFNPGSSLQKQKFFESLGIDSEKETKAGNPQWDRLELERLQRLLKIMIEEKKE